MHRVVGTALGEDTACPGCGHGSSFLFAARDLNRRLSNETFRYHRCGRCDLIFLAPVPERLAAYYPTHYYGAPPRLDDLLGAAWVAEAYKLELVQRFVPGGRLLEIGPGLGGFACLAKKAGYDVEAIEMDEECCSYLSEVIGVRAVCSAAPEAELAGEGPYDAITLWHAFEHLPDPWRTLSAASARVRPGGVVVIAAPNPDSLQFRLLGSRWAHLDAPRHLFLVPLSLLVRRAAEEGLEAIFRTTTDQGGLGWNTFGWRESLANVTKRSLLRPVAKIVGSAVSYLAVPLERTGLRGATYTVVLRKGPPQ